MLRTTHPRASNVCHNIPLNDLIRPNLTRTEDKSASKCGRGPTRLSPAAVLHSIAPSSSAAAAAPSLDHWRKFRFAVLAQGTGGGGEGRTGDGQSLRGGPVQAARQTGGQGFTTTPPPSSPNGMRGKKTAAAEGEEENLLPFRVDFSLYLNLCQCWFVARHLSNIQRVTRSITEVLMNISLQVAQGG